MNKIKIAGGLSLLIIIILSACSDMNDLHDKYLQNGEITYVGRIDSVKSFGGRDRVLIHYWITDPRVKNLQLFWNQRRDSMVVQVPAHDPLEPLEVMIGDGNSLIAEGDHTLFFYSHDEKGHKSIVFESLISVYGERYQTSLVNRPVKSLNVIEDNNLEITWNNRISTDEIGVIISYFDKNNNMKDSILLNEIISLPVLFDDIDVTKPISYKTMFVPEEFAIDTFYTSNSEAIKTTIVKNVALHKNTSVSDMLNSSYHGGNAVDGIISSASRWVSSTIGAHWIEIDLEQSYPIQRFQTYNGSGDAANMAIKNFLFQANINDEWVTIVEVSNNTNHSYGTSFEEIVTDKVRFFVPEYTDNQVRLFELEVYSIVTLN